MPFVILTCDAPTIANYRKWVLMMEYIGTHDYIHTYLLETCQAAGTSMFVQHLIKDFDFKKSRIIQ